MARPQVPVEELLLRHRAIDEDQLRIAPDHQKRTGGDLERALLELGYVSEDLLLRAQSNQLGIPLVNPAQPQPPRELARALTEKPCKRFGVIPVSGNLEAKLLRVATSLPANFERLRRSGARAASASRRPRTPPSAWSRSPSATTTPSTCSGRCRWTWGSSPARICARACRSPDEEISHARLSARTRWARFSLKRR